MCLVYLGHEIIMFTFADIGIMYYVGVLMALVPRRRRSFRERSRARYNRFKSEIG